VAGISIVAINSAIIAATGRRPGLASHRPLEVLLAAILRRELLGKLAFTAWRTWNRIASYAEALLFGQPNFITPRPVSPFLVPPAAPKR
jgi:NTE family protein